MYLNRDEGYGVINVFEIDSKYKKHEMYLSGLYNVEKDSKEEIKRKEILSTKKCKNN